MFLATLHFPCQEFHTHTLTFTYPQTCAPVQGILDDGLGGEKVCDLPRKMESRPLQPVTKETANGTARPGGKRPVKPAVAAGESAAARQEVPRGMVGDGGPDQVPHADETRRDAWHGPSGMPPRQVPLVAVYATQDDTHLNVWSVRNYRPIRVTLKAGEYLIMRGDCGHQGVGLTKYNARAHFTIRMPNYTSNGQTSFPFIA